jgi:hypothetical protein
MTLREHWTYPPVTNAATTPRALHDKMICKTWLVLTQPYHGSHTCNSLQEFIFFTTLHMSPKLSRTQYSIDILTIINIHESSRSTVTMSSPQPAHAVQNQDLTTTSYSHGKREHMATNLLTKQNNRLLAHNQQLVKSLRESEARRQKYSA